MRAEYDLRMSEYYEATRDLAGRLTEWSKGLEGTDRRFVVCNGGGRQCLYFRVERRWRAPNELHFVAGYQRDAVIIHSGVAAYEVAPEITGGTGGRSDFGIGWFASGGYTKGLPAGCKPDKKHSF